MKIYITNFLPFEKVFLVKKLATEIVENIKYKCSGYKVKENYFFICKFFSYTFLQER